MQCDHEMWSSVHCSCSWQNARARVHDKTLVFVARHFLFVAKMLVLVARHFLFVSKRLVCSYTRVQHVWRVGRWNNTDATVNMHQYIVQPNGYRRLQIPDSESEKPTSRIKESPLCIFRALKPTIRELSSHHLKTYSSYRAILSEWHILCIFGRICTKCVIH